MLNEAMNRFLAVLSYPFSSIDFLTHDYLQEYLDNGDYTVKGKKELRFKLAQYVSQRYTIYSYDEINLYLEKWYLYPEDGDYGAYKKKDSFSLVFDLLLKLSNSFISQRDGQIIYKYWENDKDKKLLGGFSGSNKIYLFHSINRLFPMDILAIVYMVKNQKKVEELEGYYGNIKVSDALLDRILNSGIAENHLHSGVSGAFLTFWDSFMKPLTKKRASELKKLIFQNSYDMEKSEVHCCLFLAGLMRAVICRAIFQIQSSTLEDSTQELMVELIGLCSVKENWHTLPMFCSDVYEWDSSAYFIEKWNQNLEGVNHDVIEANGYVRTLLGGLNSINTSEEVLFLYQTIKFIMNDVNNTKREIKNLRKLFLNYLRIKNFIYSLVVQQKTIHGLDYFSIQYYHNNSAANRASLMVNGIKKWDRVIREQLQNSDLKKLELRMSVSNNEKRFKKDVLAFLSAYRIILHEVYCECILVNENVMRYRPVKQFPKVGLVLHLLKQEQSYLPEKCLRFAEDSSYLQYGEIFENYRVQIENLKNLREEIKGLDRYLLGLDVASLENAIPSWVFGPIYKSARDSQEEPVKTGNRLFSGFQSLSFTFHAGEDYRHLLSGLRRIDEVIRHLKFHAGDRIGHGIALGVSPENWCRENQTVIIPRIEALENYIWSYYLLSQNSNDSSFINLAYLEKKIYELAKEIYGESRGITTNILVDGYLELFQRNLFSKDFSTPCKQCNKQVDNVEEKQDLGQGMFELCNYYSKNQACEILWGAGLLCQARHCRHYVNKMNEPIHYRVMEQELRIVEEIQKMVRTYVMQQGIIVEVNPSSNVTIGGLDTLADHQVYHINKEGYDMGNILTCINSDDPSVFNTNVYNELGYIYFGMLEKGVGREDLLIWIEKLRKNGMDASFIRRTDSDEQILHELDEILDGVS